MIRSHRALAALSVILLPMAVQAQGLEPDGRVELEFLSGNDASNLVLSGDVMLRYRSGRFGAEIGTDSDIVLDGNDSFTAFYAAGLIDTAYGEFAIGAPQSVADMLIDLPVFAGMQGLEAGGLLPSQPLALDAASAVGTIAKGQDAQNYGLRYSTISGGLRYGASLHRFAGRDGTLVEIAAEYTMGQTQIEGMLESRDLKGGLSGLVAVSHDAGRYSLAASLSRQTITADGTTLRLGGEYRLSDQLFIGGSLARNDYGSEQYLYGVTAGWTFGNGAALSGGIAEGDDTGLLMDASVGYRF